MNVTVQTGDAPPVALPLYVATGLAARTADAGTPVALALAAARREPPLDPSLIGLLVSALALPHLLGPVLARRLDSSADYRRVVAVACAVYAAALVGLALSLDGTAPPPVLVVLASSAGLVGPLLTGGLSSRLADLVAPERIAQERARGWDAVTYGVAGFGGPMLVVAVADLVRATTTLVALGALAGSAGVAALLLPRPARPADVRAAMPTLAVGRLLLTDGPLRRTALLTMVAACVQSAITVTAVVVGGEHGVGGATMVAALGAGNLVGSLWVTARPSARPAESRVLGWGLAQAGLFGLCALASSPAALLAAFGSAGAVSAPLFAAALAVRSDQAPPEGRAQVFVWSAGLKIGASAVGSAVGGAASGLGVRSVLVISAACLAAASATLSLQRGATRRRRRPVSTAAHPW
jgi:MFS family permease